VALVGLALARARDRGPALAAAAALAVLLVEASVDWTWSFVGLVFPVLLVAGAAAGGVDLRLGGRAVTAVAAASLASLAALAIPWQVARDVAAAAATTRPAPALQAARRARALDPWSPDALAAEGRLAEALGDDAGAASLYAAAAPLSPRPWLQRFRQARALAAAGARPQAARACALAQEQNPLEPLLDDPPCASRP
jgi:tetratricopeptide (TPR) repeat protein